MNITALFSAASGGHNYALIFLQVAALVVAAQLGGALARRVGQPAVLGELLAGVMVGGSMLGLVNPDDPAIRLLAELGVVILLFQIGLHTDLKSLLGVGMSAVLVAVTGVVLPFGAGYFAAHALGLAVLPSLVIGAAMTATSVGISARILGDLRQLNTREGQTVLGAAVLDDVIGLVILAVVAAIVAGGTISAGSVGVIVAKAFGFLIAALLLGRLLIPGLFGWIARKPAPGTVGALALAFALILAALADLGGSALILGAFAAGLIIHDTPERHQVEESTAVVGHFLVPIFFASVGAAVDLAAMFSTDSLQLGVLLLVIGIAGKFLAGYAPFRAPIRHALVGAAMVPRGEVGLIFAQMGLTVGVLTPATFGAVMLMVIGTTLVTPPWLAWLVAWQRTAGGEQRTADGSIEDIGTVDDLVAGERPNG